MSLTGQSGTVGPPDWLNNVNGINFDAEKSLLASLEEWARHKGWLISDGSDLPFELRQRTDLYIHSAGERRSFRVAVIPKDRRSSGAVRIDTSNSRIFDISYNKVKKAWRVELSNYPLTDDLLKEGWDWFLSTAFKK